MNIDMRTLLLSHFITLFASTGLVFWIWIINKKHFQGIGFWVIELGLQSVGYLLLFLDGYIPDFLSDIIANFLLILGVFFLYIGLNYFLKKKVKKIANIICLCLFLFVYTYFSIFNSIFSARLITFSVSLVFLYSQCAYLLLFKLDKSVLKITRTTGISLLVLISLSILRILAAAFFNPGSDLLTNSIADVIVLFITQIAVILVNFSLFIMISGMLYQEVKRYTETLEKSNAQLENFAYNISHDLQNHINIIISSLKVIDKKYIGEEKPDAKKLMDIAIDKIFQMSQLTSDLLSYSRIGKNKKGFTLISLEEVLNEAISNLNEKIKSKNAKIIFGKLPTIYGNKILLLNVFQNIIDNSIKYSSDKREPEIKISFKENESEWILLFSDNGMGIKPEHKDKVFDMFYRIDDIKSKIEGTGLGLASCKRIIDLHNGNIWLESEHLKGSTFYISLPKNQMPPKDF